MPLKYLSNSWRSLTGADNTNANPNNIIFTIKVVVTLSARDNQKLSKILSKGFKRSVYWNEYKTISENLQQMSIDISSNQILLKLIDYLF